MEKRRRSMRALVAMSLLAAMLPSIEAAYSSGGGGDILSQDYYKNSCPNLESIVREEVTRKKNETVVTIPAVLRLFFHDCFVDGCDASVLIASPKTAEKNSEDDESLAGDGYDTVNRVKARVEKECPGVVSCSDILALAARDVVYIADGPYWTVELGRLDGLVSRASDVKGKLPGPDMKVKELNAIFKNSGNLSPSDMIALSGAHTVGFAHCTRFYQRLYNFNGTGKTDPSFNPDYAQALMRACPRDVGPTIAVNMDPMTPITFDNEYYTNLVKGFGLFTSDQALYTDTASRKTVQEFSANQTKFFEAFTQSMIKLGRVGVKTGNSGEIRRDCTAFNH